MQSISVVLSDGSWLAVPRSLSAICTYVLLEQGDWFEPELAFVRTLVQPGMHAIDVGAGPGLYTLALARGLADEGRVWSFESCSRSYALLRESAELNDVQDLVHALPYGFGGRSRGAQGLDPCGDLEGATVASPRRWARGQTMDDQLPALTQGISIDFMRLDAGGDEASVIRGAARFLARHSPLIMVAVKQGQSAAHDAVGALRSLGFAIFRLAPGAAMLVPVNIQAGMELHERQLFAAKPDCVARLQARGLLLPIHGFADGPAPHLRWAAAADQCPYWRVQASPDTIAQLADEPGRLHALALDAYVSAQDTGQSALSRMTWFKMAQRLWVHLHHAAPEEPSYTLCLARVSHDLGERGAALGLVMRLERSLSQTSDDQLMLPALSPLARRDPMQVCGGKANWTRMAVTEAVEWWRSPSSYFNSDSCMRLLPHLDNADLARAMHRRYCLHAHRTGVPLTPRDLRRACAASADPLLQLLDAQAPVRRASRRPVHVGV